MKECRQLNLFSKKLDHFSLDLLLYSVVCQGKEMIAKDCNKGSSLSAQFFDI